MFISRASRRVLLWQHLDANLTRANNKETRALLCLCPSGSQKRCNVLVSCSCFFVYLFESRDFPLCFTHALRTYFDHIQYQVGPQLLPDDPPSASCYFLFLNNVCCFSKAYTLISTSYMLLSVGQPTRACIMANLLRSRIEENHLVPEPINCP